MSEKKRTKTKKPAKGTSKKVGAKSKSKAKKKASKSGASPRAATRPANAPLRINAQLKGLTVAAEPPIDSNPGDLQPAFLTQLTAALSTLSNAGTPFRLVEGFRTVARQEWLYGSGRPNARPYGRPGPILTNADGVNTLSKHQGDGTAGSGIAADCYPTRNGSVYIPPSSDPIWDAYAAAVVARGLVAGHNWPTLKDSPHCEEP